MSITDTIGPEEEAVEDPGADAPIDAAEAVDVGLLGAQDAALAAAAATRDAAAGWDGTALGSGLSGAATAEAMAVGGGADEVDCSRSACFEAMCSLRRPL